MQKFLYTCLLYLVALTVQGQAGKWQTYQAYYNTSKVAESNLEVFAVADGAVYSLNKDDQSVRTYSRLDKLSDVGVTQLGFNAETNTLLLVYSNGNIDLLGDDGTYNLPFLKDNTTIQDKTVHAVSFDRQYAFLSASFGIMRIDLKKKEVSDTYRIGNVYGCCVWNNSLYAATDEGILKGALTDNLLDRENWQTYNPGTDAFAAKDVRNLVAFQQALCFYVPNRGVYYQTQDGTVRTLVSDGGLAGCKTENNQLLAFTGGKAYIFRSLGTPDQITGLSNLKDISTLKDNGAYWIANGTSGLVGVQRKGNAYQKTVELPAPNSPKRNLPYFMNYEYGRLLVTGGARWADRENQPATFMRYQDGTWINFDESPLPKLAGIDYCKDFLCAATDPADTSHFFVASYGEGIFEFKGNEFVKMHTLGNSALESSAGTSRHYVRVSGLTFDEQGNLWVVSSGVNGSIKVLQRDGNWITYNNTPINQATTSGSLLIARNGIKFINNLRADKAGIFAMNDGGTIDNPGDDVYKLYSPLITSQGESLSASYFYCMAEDKNGALWVGTNIGPVVCYQTSNIEDLRFNRIVLADESDYLLNGEQINAIAVDGGNRKWLATENSGVFLVSEDGTEVLENFTTDNSPLFSNRIQSVAINPQSGEVFFGTDKGIISYMGEATEGSEDFSSVHAYPNPVRPDFDGKVIITGLMDQSSVKITDVAGHLIYQGVCTGGQFTWDCRNRQGRRVASGVYLVMAASPKAKESVVTKIMVVK